jgi:hypothetical protein
MLPMISRAVQRIFTLDIYAPTVIDAEIPESQRTTPDGSIHVVSELEVRK